MLGEASEPSSPAPRLPFAAARAALAHHGWTALFAAVSIVVVRAESATFELTDFKERVVSTPTTVGVDVVARAALFTTSVVLFVVAFAGILALLQAVRRVVSESTWPVLESLSIAGTMLWLAHAYTLDTAPTLVVLAWIQTAVLVIGVLEFSVFRGGAHPEPAAYLASLGLAAAGVVIVIADFRPPPRGDDPLWTEWHFGAWMVVLHLAAQLAAWRRDAAAHARAIRAVMSGAVGFAWLPFVSLLRDEIYLSLNNYGVLFVKPDKIELGLLGLLGLWMLRRAFVTLRGREPPRLTDTVVKAALPIFLFGITSLGSYFNLVPISSDLFEQGNPGLSIQQFFEFGRVPYLETFNAHGFSDSFWSFVYVFLHGYHDEMTGFYEFLNRAIGSVLVYWLLRRATGNAYLAFFAALFAPFRVDVFPRYCEMAIASLFVLEKVIARPTRGRFIALGFYCVAVFLWRLDIGAANLVACAGVLAATRLASSRFRPRLLDVVVAGVACAVVCGGAFLALAAVRGVSAIQVLSALAHIVASSQGFGQDIAHVLEPSVLWHLTVFPLAVLAVMAIALAAARARDSVPLDEEPARALGEPAFRTLFLLYGAIYYFANFQRGLVRHTWVEPGNVFVLSFGFAVLCVATHLVRNWTARTAAIAFLLAGTLLSGSFGLQGPLPKRAESFDNLWQKTIAHLEVWGHAFFRRAPIDRSPSSPDLEQHHFAAVRKFVAANLEDGQTFVDLTQSPMLYVITHRRSPHYLNHLYLAHDEWLQKNEAIEFDKHDVPFVFAWMEEDLATKDGDVANQHNFGDTVHNSVRQWVFHEWLDRGYEPWRIVQRWQVWRRHDWLAPAAPEGEGLRSIATAKPGAPGSGVKLKADDAASPLVTLATDRIAFLRIDGAATKGAAPASITVTLALADPRGVRQEVKRKLEVASGDKPRFWTLPYDAVGSALYSIAVDPTDAGFAIREVSLSDVVAPDYSEISTRAKLKVCPTLGEAAWYWANADERHAWSRPVLREMQSQNPGAPARNSPRFSFEPLADPSEPCYVALRIRKLKPDARRSGIVWGRDESSIGRLNFDLKGEGLQDYLVRVSSQYSWTHTACNWITIPTQEDDVEVVSARLLKGD